MTNPSFEPVSVECECIRETTLAILVCVAKSDEEIWFPKSQINDDSEVVEEGDSGDLVVPRWLAEDKGVEYAEWA